MKLNKLGPNKSEVVLANGVKVFFSYKTPVAYYNPVNGMYFKTSKKWSVTTSKHINQWLDGVSASLISQNEIDSLV